MKVALSALTFAWLVTSTTAQANFDACGGIFVAGDAKCECREKEECTTQCTSETVQTACAAKLYVSCEQECTASATTTCETSCSSGCTTTCTEQAPSKEPPNCVGLCVSDCKKTCARQGPRGACCSSRSCANEIKARLDIDIDLHEIGDSIEEVADDTVDSTKDAYGKAKKKSKELCSLGPIGATTPVSASSALLLLAGLALVVRRRRAS